MIRSRIEIIITVLAALIIISPAYAIQMGENNAAWSAHSYEQERPQPQEEIKEDIPIIIHNPLPEIPSNKDFFIVATIRNIGAGTPIVHYRFGENKDYFTRVLHQSEPGEYGLKILSAALTDENIEYYIDVTTGARSLASFGSETNPVQVKIVSPRPMLWLIAAGILAAISALLFRFTFYRPDVPIQVPEVFKEKKSNFNSMTSKYSRV
jgi:hypothetical protein